NEPQRIEQMTAEHLRTPAIIGEGRKRLDRIVLSLPGAKMILERPRGSYDRRGDAELLLFPREQRLMFFYLSHAGTRRDSCQHLAVNLDEVLIEEALSS